MAKYFIHPNLYTKNDNYASQRILNLETGKFLEENPYYVGAEHQVSFSLDEYLSKLRDINRVRDALKIPVMSYCAHSFPRLGYNAKGVLDLIEWARERYETRFWINMQSALMLICIADPDLSEDAGWEFYNIGKNIPGRASYHMPAWWEFCQNGTLIPAEWKLEICDTGEFVKCYSPDKRYGMLLGGI